MGLGDKPGSDLEHNTPQHSTRTSRSNIGIEVTNQDDPGTTWSKLMRLKVESKEVDHPNRDTGFS